MTPLESNGANRDQKLNFGRVIRGTNMESNPINKNKDKPLMPYGAESK